MNLEVSEGHFGDLETPGLSRGFISARTEVNRLAAPCSS